MFQFLSNPALAWTLVLLATIGETIWFIALKKWGTIFPWNALLYILVALNITLLTFALKNLPVGTVYAFWTGASAVGITLLGIYLYGEPMSFIRLAFIAITIVGLVGLQLTNQ